MITGIYVHVQWYGLFGQCRLVLKRCTWMITNNYTILHRTLLQGMTTIVWWHHHRAIFVAARSYLPTNSLLKSTTAVCTCDIVLWLVWVLSPLIWLFEHYSQVVIFTFCLTVELCNGVHTVLGHGQNECNDWKDRSKSIFCALMGLTMFWKCSLHINYDEDRPSSTAEMV